MASRCATGKSGTPDVLLSFMYAAALEKCASLLQITGWPDAARTMLTRMEQVRSSLKQLAWSEERQLFRDLPDLEIYSQHTQVMAVLSEVVKGEEAKRLMERALSESIHRVTLPFSYLLFQALKKSACNPRSSNCGIVGVSLPRKV